MRHVSDAVLRRLDDEPLAVPDQASEHVESCGRCSARRAQITADTEYAVRVFSGPQLVPDVDLAWSRLRRQLDARGADTPAPARRRSPVRVRRTWSPRVSLRAGLAIGAAGVVVAGTAAAATLTTIFAPTHVAAISVTQSDMRALSAFTGLDGSQPLGGFTTSNGSSTMRFGTVRWSSGARQPVSTLAQATARAGFPVAVPGHLPAGVGPLQQVVLQPRVSATVSFGAAAAGLMGSSVTIAAGPAVVERYGAANGGRLPTLVIATMRRPTAQSTGASIGQIEAFLLRQPGVPPQLVEEVRLLGDLRTTLPVPVPSGLPVRSVRIGGMPGVLVSDPSNAVAGVVWEDGHGLLHGVAGILSSQDVLNVASQLS